MTDEHPFFVPGHGWTKARDLTSGDPLLSLAAQPSTVTANTGEHHPQGLTVYNLEVEHAHTYFVRAEASDAQPVWVHNADERYLAAARARMGDGPDAAALNLWIERRMPQHHLFPQAKRSWFVRRGVDIDDYAVDLDRAIHEAVHGGGDWRLAKAVWTGEWNTQMMARLRAAESVLPAGQRLKRSQIEQIGRDMMEDYGIAQSWARYERR